MAGSTPVAYSLACPSDIYFMCILMQMAILFTLGMNMNFSLILMFLDSFCS